MLSWHLELSLQLQLVPVSCEGAPVALTALVAEFYLEQRKKKGKAAAESGKLQRGIRPPN